jgi:hypothetical protein
LGDNYLKIKIFKSGDHTSSNGIFMSFTEDIIQKIVNSYNVSVHEAPIVIGHPKIDDPAYGWVSSLSTNDFGEIEAEIDQVEPAFAELVNAGRFKKVSASFYNPDSEINPVKGTYYLRHVGFLGATPPAIKGLGNVSFNETEDLIQLEMELDYNEKKEELIAEYTEKPDDRFRRLLRETVKDKINTIIKSGVPLGDVDELVDFCDSLVNTSDFSESKINWFFAFLSRLPKMVNFSELTKDDVQTFKEVKKQLTTHQLAQLARDKALNDKISFTEAVKFYM